MRNRRLNHNSSTKAKGVHKRSDNGLWRAYISKDGKRFDLGTFKTIGEAKRSVDIARDWLHGRFARKA